MNVQFKEPQAEQLTPFRFFEGDMEFSGFVQDLAGKVRRHYRGTIACEKTDDRLVLDEFLQFNDGANERRVWKISRTANGISGTAEDLVGEATMAPEGQDEMRWTYVMEIEIGGKRRPFDFQDVFVQTADDTMVAKTTMSKFGIPLARLYSTYRKI